MKRYFILIIILLLSIGAYAEDLPFDFNNKWQVFHYKDYSITDNVFKGVTDSIPVLQLDDVNIDADKYRYLLFDAKLNNNASGSIYFAFENGQFAEDKKQTFWVENSKDFKTYVVDMKGSQNWLGSVKSFRIDVIYAPNTSVEIENIRFSDNPVVKEENKDNLLKELVSKNKKLSSEWEFPKDKNINLVVNSDNIKVSAINQAKYIIKSNEFSFENVGYYETLLKIVNINGNVKARIVLKDAFHKDLKDIINIYPNKSLTFECPKLAVFGQLIIEGDLKANTNISISNSYLKYLKDMSAQEDYKKKLNGLSWKASWIWIPKEVTVNYNTPYYFRNRLKIADVSKIKSAYTTLTSDDMGKLWINGSILPQGEFCDNWQRVDLYDIKSSLKNGDNVIGVEMMNRDNWGAVISETFIEFTDGSVMELNTDSNWKCSNKVNMNWSTSEDTDDNWYGAVSLGVPPAGIWSHRVDYVYIGKKIKCSDIKENLPNNIDTASVVDLDLSFNLEEKLSQDIVLSIDLIDNNNSFINLKKYDIKSGNNKVMIKDKIDINPYISGGKYKIRVYSPTLNLNILKDINITQNRKASLPKVRFDLSKGNPVFEINNKKYPTYNHCTFNTTANSEYIKNSADVGLNIYNINVENIYYEGNNTFNFRDVDKQVLAVLLNDPNAYIIIGTSFGGVDNPGLKAWNDENPDELCVDSNGNKNLPAYLGGTITCPSMASSKWLDSCDKIIKDMISHIENSSYADRIIGIMPNSGVTWEWQQWGSAVADATIYVDYSTHSRLAFIKWLENKYGDVASLNKAWNTNFASFDMVTIPTPKERSVADVGDFIDPVKHMKEIDFRRYYSELVADDVNRLCNTVKRESKGQMLTGTYYGYILYVLTPRRYQFIGHSALYKVLDNPNIDFLISPSIYSQREIGNGAGFMSVTDSVYRNKKVWIDQADLRTHYSTDTLASGTNNISDDIEVEKRHFSNALINGCSEQILDFSLGWVMGDTRLTSVLKKSIEIEKEVSNLDRKIQDTDLAFAVILDENSLDYTQLDSNIHFDTVTIPEMQFAHTGTGFDTYTLSDLKNIPTDYKMYVFLNTFRITKEQEEYINKNFKNNNKTLVFMMQPGITDGNTLDINRVAKITGINMNNINLKDLNVKPIVKDEITSFVDPNKTYGSGNIFSPIFSPLDGVSYGVLSDGVSSGLAVKKFDNWTSVYSSVPNLPSDLLRGIARYSGVHIFNYDKYDTTYAGDKLFSINTLSGGKRTFYLPIKTGVVKELFTNRTYDIKNGIIELELMPRSTTLFLYE